jgi:hypothetical protein
VTSSRTLTAGALALRPAPGWTGLRRASAWPAFVAATALILTSGPARAARPRVYAITAARIVVSPGHVIDRGTVVIRDGTIAAVGASVSAPADAQIVDGKDLTITAGLIDPFTRIGMPKPAGEGEGGGRREGGGKVQEKPSERGPGRANIQVRSDAKASQLFQMPPNAELERMRGMGFTAALAVPDGGAFRGTSALVHLAGDDAARAILVPDVAAHMAFETAPGDVYPSALMGVIALIRQTFEDATRQGTWEDRWKRDPRGLERPPVSPTLDAAKAILDGKRVFFEAEDTHAYARIARIAREFSFAPAVVGNGYEYEVLDEIGRDKFTIVLPVNFPDPPHVEDAETTIDLTLRELRRWDRAPGNPAALQKAGVPFAMTTHQLKRPGDFRKNVRKAIERGLPADAALEAVTIAPARLLGVDGMLGTVEVGKIADLVLADGDLFAEKTTIKKVFIDGEPFENPEESKDFDPNAKVDPKGTWDITYSGGGGGGAVRTLRISGGAGSLSGTAETASGKVDLTGLALTGNKLTGAYRAEGGTVEFSAIIKRESMSGTATFPDGRRLFFSGTRTSKSAGPGEEQEREHERDGDDGVEHDDPMGGAR